MDRLTRAAVAGAALTLSCVVDAAPPPSPGLFAQRCSMCHQANGGGVPGQFPRLAGRLGTVAQTPVGRHYLALVLLNGMAGTITVDHQAISGLMPSMAALPDQQIADLLNQALSLGPPAKGKRPVPFTAAEIGAVRREGGLSASAVAGVRAKLAASNLIP